MQCQLDYITSLRQDAARRDALNRLPPGLPATYICMLERIGQVPHDLTIARTALTWLIFSRRPLKLRELSVAAVIEADTEFDGEQLLDSEEILLEICGSLIKRYEDRQIVTFSHFSVREFLTIPVLPDGTVNRYFVSEADGNALLMKSCFSYLRSGLRGRSCTTISELSKLHSDSFLTYTMYNWPHHSQTLTDDMSITNRIVSLFESEFFPTWSQAWVQSEETGRWNIWNREARIRDFGYQVEIPATPLYFAAMFGFHQVAKALLDKGSSANVPGGLYDYPIFVAIVNENLEVLRALLEGGANTQVQRRSDQGIYGESPLHLAAGLWNVEIVTLLIDFNADVNAKTRIGFTPLCEALSEEDAEPMPQLVKLLLPDPRAFTSKLCSSPLHVAAQYDQHQSARIILEGQGSVYVNASNEVGDTPLHLAVRRKSRRVVSLLLEFGAKLTIRGQYGWTPLQLAAWDRNIAMMEYLGKFSVRNLPPPDWTLCKPRLPDPTPVITTEANTLRPIRRKVHSSVQYLALEHMLLTDPSDHIWRIFLADY